VSRQKLFYEVVIPTCVDYSSCLAGRLLRLLLISELWAFLYYPSLSSRLTLLPFASSYVSRGPHQFLQGMVSLTWAGYTYALGKPLKILYYDSDM